MFFKFGLWDKGRVVPPGKEKPRRSSTCKKPANKKRKSNKDEDQSSKETPTDMQLYQIIVCKGDKCL